MSTSESSIRPLVHCAPGRGIALGVADGVVGVDEPGRLSAAIVGLVGLGVQVAGEHGDRVGPAGPRAGSRRSGGAWHVFTESVVRARRRARRRVARSVVAAAREVGGDEVDRARVGCERHPVRGAQRPASRSRSLATDPQRREHDLAVLARIVVVHEVVVARAEALAQLRHRAAVALLDRDDLGALRARRSCRRKSATRPGGRSGCCRPGTRCRAAGSGSRRGSSSVVVPPSDPAASLPLRARRRDEHDDGDEHPHASHRRDGSASS